MVDVRRTKFRKDVFQNLVELNDAVITILFAISTLMSGSLRVELVAKGSRRRWKVIAGVAGVVALVIVVVVLLVVFLTKDDESPDSVPQTSSGRGPSLEDVLDRKYTAKDFNGTLLAGGEFIYRKTNGHVYLYNMESNTETALLTDDDLSSALQTSISTVDPKNHQLVVWAPQGNGYVYVHGNNIVYRSSAADIVDKVITSTGVVGLIYHGIPDWVYEEEVFSSNKALWFSPNGEWLAFASFNDTVARVMNIPYYGPPGNLEFQYTRAIPLRYPKVLKISEPSGWIDLFTPPKFSQDGSRLVLIHPQDQGSGLGSYRHVTLVDRSSNTPVSLTSGQFVVTHIHSWDYEQGLIYFMATKEGAPSQLHLYSVSDSATSAPHLATCLSCNVKTSNNDDCLYCSAEFGESSSHYVFTCLGPGIPQVSLYNRVSHTQLISHHQITMWEDNTETKDLVKEILVPRIEVMDVEVADGFKAKVQLWLPPDIDTSGSKKYPLLVVVYGGPDSFQVTERFQVDWSTYLTTNKSYIYAAIDGRGSGLKGNSMLFAGYRQLGSVEITDQINVTKHLQDTLGYIDNSRSAIWGWSYGGYSTGMVLAKDSQNVFKCGMSVAPVSDWIYYDSIYTERYMGLPTVSDNLGGYVESSLINKVAELKGKQFLLIHGTLDDNVHYQQSMMLARALELNDIPFSQQTYPDEEHGLSGVRPHLYHTLDHFLEECFQ
uniref:Venom dipeptidyl peptidase 4 n=1 Tax=Timema californicum TaxID=61474 RepID=A0A7R9J126_TIMCA|nr:unnamed protein product [Timema californicum]